MYGPGTRTRKKNIRRKKNNDDYTSYGTLFPTVPPFPYSQIVVYRGIVGV